MDLVKARAWWYHRQSLGCVDANLSNAQTLEKVGWLRSIGGSSPYVALFARNGKRRADFDRDLESAEIHELPSARGCTYVIPKSEYGLALRVSQGFADESAMRTARNYLGVTDKEIDLLQDRVVEALASGPKDPKELKDAVGDAARNLGEEGRKRGQTTTLPLALGFLQSSGRIRRIPSNGRIDQQRYRYAAWDMASSPDLKIDRMEAFSKLANRYFSWIGPATAAHYQAFAGLGVKDSKEALALAGVKPLNEDSEWLILPEEQDAFSAFEASKEPSISLVCSIDPILLHKRDLPNLVADRHKGKTMIGEKGAQIVGSGLQDISNHAILDRGAVIGVWEYDPEAQEIVAYAFDGMNSAIENAVAHMEQFIREDLGDCRSFSLDSPASRIPKLNSLRELARSGH